MSLIASTTGNMARKTPVTNATGAIAIREGLPGRQDVEAVTGPQEARCRSHRSAAPRNGQERIPSLATERRADPDDLQLEIP